MRILTAVSLIRHVLMFVISYYCIGFLFVIFFGYTSISKSSCVIYYLVYKEGTYQKVRTLKSVCLNAKNQLFLI